MSRPGGGVCLTSDPSPQNAKLPCVRLLSTLRGFARAYVTTRTRCTCHIHSTPSFPARSQARASRSCPLIRVLHRSSVEQQAATTLIHPAQVQTDAAIPRFESQLCLGCMHDEARGHLARHSPCINNGKLDELATRIGCRRGDGLQGRLAGIAATQLVDC